MHLRCTIGSVVALGRPFVQSLLFDISGRAVARARRRGRLAAGWHYSLLLVVLRMSRARVASACVRVASACVRARAVSIMMSEY